MTGEARGTRAQPRLALALDDPDAVPEVVGGKGASLARLARAGVRVPPGFHVTTAAYPDFLDGGLREELLAAVSLVDVITGFPGAAAVVTDVGAPLSHAAIVAREAITIAIRLYHGLPPAAARDHVPDLAEAVAHQVGWLSDLGLGELP
jgi:pyruvate,water dikinase